MTATTTPAATTTTTARVTCHLCEARVNVLLRLLQNANQVSGLLGICSFVS
jgi:hypothetical protein